MVYAGPDLTYFFSSILDVIDISTACQTRQNALRHSMDCDNFVGIGTGIIWDFGYLPQALRRSSLYLSYYMGMGFLWVSCHDGLEPAQKQALNARPETRLSF